MSNTEEAKKYFKEGLKSFNDSDFDDSDFEKVIDCFTMTIEFDPVNTNAYICRGVAYQNKGDYDKAIEDYDKVIELDSDYAEAYESRGLAYEDKDNYEKAIKDYTKVIELNPDDLEAYNDIARVYLHKGDCDKTITELERIHRNNNNYYTAQLVLGMIYREKGKDNEAIEFFERIPKNESNYSTAQTEIRVTKKIIMSTLDITNKNLAMYFKEKGSKLKEEIKHYPSWFIRFIFTNIAIIIGIIVAKLIFLEEISKPFFQVNILCSTAILFFLWIARFFNKHVHETIQPQITLDFKLPLKKP